MGSVLSTFLFNCIIFHYFYCNLFFIYSFLFNVGENILNVGFSFFILFLIISIEIYFSFYSFFLFLNLGKKNYSNVLHT